MLVSVKQKIEGLKLINAKILGQEIYKEFDYFIRFLHHRVLKVRSRMKEILFFFPVWIYVTFSVERISIVFNAKVKN
jgi:hypothetical protein